MLITKAHKYTANSQFTKEHRQELLLQSSPSIWAPIGKRLSTSTILLYCEYYLRERIEAKDA